MNGHLSTANAGERSNGFGALRLLFALLVIIEHVGFLCGTRVPRFGRIGVGSLAVDGFFLISGFLVTGSALSSGAFRYLWKRVLRIYPGFIACSILLILVVRPLAGGTPVTLEHWRGPLIWMVLLHDPVSGGAFAGLPLGLLDGSMWTIAYEFRCYLLALALVELGLCRRPAAFGALTLTVLALYLLALFPKMRDWDESLPLWFQMVFGTPINTARFAGLFLVGGWFRLHPVGLDGRAAAGCALALVPLAFVPKLGEIAVTTLGAYVLFWVAFKCEWRLLRTINTRNDISYGVYLYGWPVTSLVLWYWREVSFASLLGASMVGALACGLLSWRVVEQPALAWKDSAPQELWRSGPGAVAARWRVRLFPSMDRVPRTKSRSLTPP